jgi:hypothetical protein
LFIFEFRYHDQSEEIPQWYFGYYWYFDKNPWVDALLWIFIVIPITIFTYWLYEPVLLQKYRLQFWAYVREKCGCAKDEASDCAKDEKSDEGGAKGEQADEDDEGTRDGARVSFGLEDDVLEDLRGSD